MERPAGQQEFPILAERYMNVNRPASPLPRSACEIHASLSATVAGGLAGKVGGAGDPDAFPRTRLPAPSSAGLLLGGTAALSKPLLADCQLAFRIGLARQRTASYPCDSMDFIMMDLERPEGRTRHAYWCTGDLTGRLLEFLSCCEGIDGRWDPRLKSVLVGAVHGALTRYDLPDLAAALGGRLVIEEPRDPLGRPALGDARKTKAGK